MNKLTSNQKKELLSIQKNHPALTFQNNGYEYLDTDKLTEEEKIALARVNELLKSCIEGFSKFNNFNISKSGVVRARVQYMWSSLFTGVGYFDIESL